ncbi:hypothetical protein CDD83_7135 [Cordyceps sp. RAO-2017]|nr:hypothetical protein CDD83_7135 [Cordyceps sp. RAO-2017]
MSTAHPLFPASLVPPDAASSLDASFTLRPLDRGDYARGFLDCLAGLTWMGDVSQAQWDERFDDMNTGGNGPYYYLVIELAGRIVATGAVIAEKKFIQNRAVVGHIEEICVAEDHRGKGLGLVMVRALDSLARKVGCSKNILNCGPKNEAFYIRCGYTRSGIEMRHDLAGGADS